jgi:Tol biopolymer transport system component
VADGRNWEVFLGDLAGGEPLRLTYNTGFDGLPSLSRNGKKMLFARSDKARDNLSTFVMDMTSFDLGPAAYKGIPDTVVGANPVLVTDFHAGR